ncbi:MAG: MurR/RpiR family transcriptional regulator [Mycobacteriales bacterium]
MSTPDATLLSHIRSLLPSLPPAERRVATVATDDPARVAALTISELAGECSTSETTVVRFCRAVGLRGYPDLRIALASAAAMSGGLGPIFGAEIAADDSLDDVVKKVGFADARAVEETIEQLDVASLRAVVDAVVAARRIEVYGVGASALIALDLQQKLHRIGRVVFAWPDPHTALTSAALLTRHDVAIGISHTGETIDTASALSQAKERGAVTVAVTNYPRSSIARLAQHVLTTATRETTFRSGAMTSRIAALTLVDCLFVAVAQRDYAATVDALDRTREVMFGARKRFENGRRRSPGPAG